MLLAQNLIDHPVIPEWAVYRTRALQQALYESKGMYAPMATVTHLLDIGDVCFIDTPIHYIALSNPHVNGVDLNRRHEGHWQILQYQDQYRAGIELLMRKAGGGMPSDSDKFCHSRLHGASRIAWECGDAVASLEFSARARCCVPDLERSAMAVLQRAEAIRFASAGIIKRLVLADDSYAFGHTSVLATDILGASRIAPHGFEDVSVLGSGGSDLEAILLADSYTRIAEWDRGECPYQNCYTVSDLLFSVVN